MTFWANWLTFLSQCEDVAGRLDPRHSYKITVEPVEAREAAFRLWHSFRDLYAGTLGPRDKEECKQRLKFKTGTADCVKVFQKLQFDAERLEHRLMVIDGWQNPTREGGFAIVTDPVTGDPMTVFLISIGRWTADELLESLDLIKADLDENGVDHSRLSGGI